MLILFALVFAFLAMLCWGFGDFFIQHSVRKMGDIETLTFLGLIGALLLTPMVLPELILLFDMGNLLVLLALGLITLAAALITFEAFKRGKLSVTEVIIELELPITILLGFIFFNESPTIFQLGIIVFIFIGLILVATKSFKHYKNAFEKGVLFAVVAALLMGSTNFLVAASARQLAPIISIWATWVFTGVIGLAIIYRREGIKKVAKNIWKYKWLVAVTTLFDTGAWVFYAFAISEKEVGIITAITESYTIIGVILGVLVNKEKIKLHQALGGMIAIAACIVLAMTLF
jgi:drug/metabolite transporter (DMT)-like permease